MDWTIILFWTSVVTGGLVVFLFLLSLMGHEFESHVDVDHDVSGGDHGDTDGNSLGIIKSSLIFIAMGAWIARTLLLEDFNWIVAIIAGIVSGYLAMFLLAKFLGFLLKQQQEGNWKHENAVGTVGDVYLGIPEGGVGQIQININGGLRTVDAVAYEGSIPMGKKVAVVGVNAKNQLVVTDMHLPNTDGEFEKLVQLSGLAPLYDEEKII